MIDIHSHILPGIDDGARSLENSVEIVRELASQGVTDIIATPHYVDESIYTSSRIKNLHLLDELKRSLQSHSVDVNIYLGNEIYINDKIESLIETGEISTLAGSDYLLVELPMSGEYPNYFDIMITLKQLGYQVVLAHPERYVAVQDDIEVVRELYNSGVHLQCNLGSILGQYGKHAKKTVKELAKNKMIFAFGSDIHHCNNVWSLKKVKEKLAKYYDKDELRQIMVNNPRKIIERAV